MMHSQGVMQHCHYERPPPSGLYDFDEVKLAQKPSWQVSQHLTNLNSFVNNNTAESQHQHSYWKKNLSDPCIATMPLKKGNNEESVAAGPIKRNYTWKRRGPKGPCLKATICDWKIPLKQDRKQHEFQNDVSVIEDRMGTAESRGFSGGRSSEPKRGLKRKNKTAVESESVVATTTNGTSSSSPPLDATVVAFCKKNPKMTKILNRKPVVVLDRISQEFIDKQTNRSSSAVCNMSKQSSTPSAVSNSYINGVVSTSLCQTNKDHHSTCLASGHKPPNVAAQTSTQTDHILVDPKIMLLSTPLQTACKKGKNASSMTFKLPKNRGMGISPTGRKQGRPKKQTFNLEKLRNKMKGANLVGNLRKSNLSSLAGLPSSITNNVLADKNSSGKTHDQLGNNEKSEYISIESLKSNFKAKLDSLCIPKDIFDADKKLLNNISSGEPADAQKAEHLYNGTSYPDANTSVDELYGSPVHQEAQYLSESLVKSVKTSACKDDPYVFLTSDEETSNDSVLFTKKDELKVKICRRIVENSFRYSLSRMNSDLSVVPETNFSFSRHDNKEVDSSDSACASGKSVKMDSRGQTEEDSAANAADAAGDGVKISMRLQESSVKSDTGSMHKGESSNGETVTKLRSDTDQPKEDAVSVGSDRHKSCKPSITGINNVGEERSDTMQTEINARGVETSAREQTEMNASAESSDREQTEMNASMETSDREQTEINARGVETSVTEQTEMNASVEASDREQTEINARGVETNVTEQTEMNASVETSDRMQTEINARGEETSDRMQTEINARGVETSDRMQTEINAIVETSDTKQTEINARGVETGDKEQTKMNAIDVETNYTMQTEMNAGVETSDVEQTEINARGVESSDTKQTEMNAIVQTRGKKHIEMNASMETSDTKQTEINATDVETSDREHSESNSAVERSDVGHVDFNIKGYPEQSDTHSTMVERTDRHGTELSLIGVKEDNTEKAEITEADDNDLYICYLKQSDTHHTENFDKDRNSKEQNEISARISEESETQKSDMEQTELNINNEMSDLKQTENNVDAVETGNLKQTENNVDAVETDNLKKTENNVDAVETDNLKQTENNVDAVETGNLKQTENNVSVTEQIDLKQSKLNINEKSDLMQTEHNAGVIETTDMMRTEVNINEKTDLKQTENDVDVVETADLKQTENDIGIVETTDLKQTETDYSGVKGCHSEQNNKFGCIERNVHDTILEHNTEQNEISARNVKTNYMEQTERNSVGMETSDMEKTEIGAKGVDRNDSEQTEISVMSVETGDREQTEIMDLERSIMKQNVINVQDVGKSEPGQTKVDVSDVEICGMEQTTITDMDVERTDMEQTEVTVGNLTTDGMEANEIGVTGVKKDDTEGTNDTDQPEMNDKPMESIPISDEIKETHNSPNCAIEKEESALNDEDSVADPELVDSVVSPLTELQEKPQSQSEDSFMSPPSELQEKPQSQTEDSFMSPPSELQEKPQSQTEDSFMSLPSELQENPQIQSEDSFMSPPSELQEKPQSQTEDSFMSPPSELQEKPQTQTEDSFMSPPSKLQEKPQSQSEDSFMSPPSELQENPQSQTEDSFMSPPSELQEKPQTQSEDSFMSPPSELQKNPQSQSEDSFMSPPSELQENPQIQSEDSFMSPPSELQENPQSQTEDSFMSPPSELQENPQTQSEDSFMSPPSELQENPQSQSEDSFMSPPSELQEKPQTQSEDSFMSPPSELQEKPQTQSEDSFMSPPSELQKNPQSQSEDSFMSPPSELQEKPQTQIEANENEAQILSDGAESTSDSKVHDPASDRSGSGQHLVDCDTESLKCQTQIAANQAECKSSNKVNDLYLDGTVPGEHVVDCDTESLECQTQTAVNQAECKSSNKVNDLYLDGTVPGEHVVDCDTESLECQTQTAVNQAECKSSNKVNDISLDGTVPGEHVVDCDTESLECQTQTAVNQAECKSSSEVNDISLDGSVFEQQLVDCDTELLQPKDTSKFVVETEIELPINKLIGPVNSDSNSSTELASKENKEKTQEVDDKTKSTMLPTVELPNTDVDTSTDVCTEEVEPNTVESNSSSVQNTTEPVVDIPDPATCQTEPDVKPLCVISSVQGAALVISDDENPHQGEDECPELEECQTVKKYPVSSFNYVYSPTPPPLININTGLISASNPEASPLPLLSPLASVHATNACVSLEKNNKASLYNRFILSKPGESSNMKKQTVVAITQAVIAPCVVTEIPHLSMSLPIVVGMFPETVLNDKPIQASQFANNNGLPCAMNVSKDTSTELLTHTKSAAPAVTNEFPITVTSNSTAVAEERSPMLWNCQSLNTQNAISSLVPVHNGQSQSFIQQNPIIMPDNCSADVVNSQGLASGIANSVAVAADGGNSLHKDVSLDDLAGGRNSPQTDDSDATMIYCEEEDIVERDMEESGKSSHLTRSAQLVYGENTFMNNHKQLKEKQDTLKVTITGLRKKLEVDKRKKKQHKKHETTTPRGDKNEVQHDVSSEKKHQIKNQQDVKENSFHKKTKLASEKKSKMQKKSRAVKSTAATFQDVFQNSVNNELPEKNVEEEPCKIPQNPSEMPLEKGKSVKRRNRKGHIFSRQKKRRHKGQEMVMEHAEDLDCEELPTILPPKRLRRRLNSEHGVMQDSLTRSVSARSSERIQRELPRHNWLEKKINKLQESTSPQRSTDSSPDIVPDEQNSSSSKEKVEISHSLNSSPDHHSPVSKSRHKRRSRSKAKSSKSKVAKLNAEQNNNQSEEHPSEKNGLGEVAVHSSDAENKLDNLFASTTLDIENPLQIDIPADSATSQLPPLNEDPDSASKDRDDVLVMQESTVENAKDRELSPDRLPASIAGNDEDDDEDSLSNCRPVDRGSQEPSDSGSPREVDNNKTDDNHRTIDGHSNKPMDLSTKRQEVFISTSKQKVYPPVQKVLPQIHQPSERTGEESSLSREVTRLTGCKLNVSFAPAASGSATIASGSTSVESSFAPIVSGEISEEILSGDTFNNISRISVVSPIKVTEMRPTYSQDHPNCHQSSSITDRVQLEATPTEKLPTTASNTDNENVQEHRDIQSERDNTLSLQAVVTSISGITSPSTSAKSLVPGSVSMISSKSDTVTSTQTKLPANTPLRTTQGQDVAKKQAHDGALPVDLSVICIPEHEKDKPSSSVSADPGQPGFNKKTSEAFPFYSSTAAPISSSVQDMYMYNKEFQKHLLEFRQLEALAAKKEQERRHILRLYKQKAHILKVISSKCKKPPTAAGTPATQTDVNPALVSEIGISAKDLKTTTLQRPEEPAGQQEPHGQQQLDLSISSTSTSRSVITNDHVQEISSLPKSKTKSSENLPAEKRRPIVQLINLAMLEARQSYRKNLNNADLKSDENKIPAHQNKVKTTYNIEQACSIPYPGVLSCPYIKRLSPIHEPSNWRSATQSLNSPHSAHSQPPFHIAGTLIIPAEEQSQADVASGRRKLSQNTEGLSLAASTNRPSRTSPKSNMIKGPKEQYPRKPEAAKDHSSPDSGKSNLQALSHQAASSGVSNRKTVHSNSQQSLPHNSNLLLHLTNKTPVDYLVMKGDESKTYPVVDLTKENDVCSKMTLQSSSTSEPTTSRPDVESREQGVQRELHEALAIQSLQRVGLVDSRKSVKGPFTSVPDSYTFPAVNHTTGEGPSTTVPSLMPLASNGKQHVSNSSKSQGAYIQKRISHVGNVGNMVPFSESNSFNGPKPAADHYYLNNTPLSQTYSLPGENVNYPQKEQQFCQGRQQKEVVHWCVGRNPHTYMQAPDPCVSDSQLPMTSMQKQFQHHQVQQQTHFMQQQQQHRQQSPHQLAEAQCRQAMVGFYNQPPGVGRMPEVQQFQAPMVRMHGSQQPPTGIPPHLISPQGSAIVQDCRGQGPVSGSKQRNPSVYMPSPHQAAPSSSGSTMPVQNSKQMMGVAQYQQQPNRPWPRCPPVNSINTDHVQHMSQPHRLTPGPHMPHVRQQSQQQPIIQPQQQQPPMQQQQQQQQQQQLNTSQCVVCGAHAIFLCSCCKRVWYCSKPCQNSHWTQHAPDCTYSTRAEVP
ncbi:uncharacterized protein LOC121369289 isoform X2 [Gigantopelta aegis]|uniref:uncharacterized protein LOC121369289 isoform X2 n=1 Tax=Gigantopelta aegis TaxID=1735272 RepID=UPI001B8890BC|nr:uncharacterized protein LOC121369289 isoform X2 [Gigantopelta aegis]